MNRNTILILSILTIGSIGIVYASGTVITNNYITTPTLNATNINVSGTCTGCGGGEGSFTTYNLFLNETVAGTGFAKGQNILVSNDGSSISSDSRGDISIIKSDGTNVITDTPFLSNPWQNQMSQSGTGVYKVFLNSSHNALIYKNNSLLTTITLDYTSNFSSSEQNLAIGVSPNGHYVGIYGLDHAGSLQRIQIFQGS